MPEHDPQTPDTLVRALFAINARTPDDVFEGWHNPDRHWNGFAVPCFDCANALRVMAWAANNETPEATSRTTFRWDDDHLVMTETFDDEQYDQRVGPGYCTYATPRGHAQVGARFYVPKPVHKLDKFVTFLAP
jgi:hypothetical protein